MKRTLLQLAPLAAAWLGLCACSIERVPYAAACVQGRAEACTCADGSQGAAVCAADGVFGACQCAAPITGELQPPVLPPRGGAAGSAGSGGHDVMEEGTAGIGASPAIDAGGLPRDASGGTLTDDAGFDASSGGAGGATHEPTPKRAPRPGEAYGPCRANGSCDQPLFCSLDATGTPYCAAFCSTGFGTACPPHPSGTEVICVTGICVR
jgi:hypothetical protein